MSGSENAENVEETQTQVCPEFYASQWRWPGPRETILQLVVENLNAQFSANILNKLQPI